MRLVVIESPYAGEVERNLLYARRAMRDCLRRGEAPIAFHLLYTQPGILDDSIPDERKLGIAAGLEWAMKASLICFYTDYGWSRGMEGALTFYKGLPFQIITEYRQIGHNPE